MPEMTIPQWAASEGISKQSAYRRVKTGKVTLNAKGLVDAEKATAQWEANKDLRQQRRGSPHAAPSSSAATHADPGPKFRPFATEDRNSLAEAQRAREWLRVKREKIAVEMLEGKLLDADTVRLEWSRLIVTAKGKLLPIADELSHVLAGETDPIRCREIVENKIHAALRELSRFIPEKSANAA